MFKRLFVGIIAIPLFVFWNILPAFAAPSVYNDPVYVGNYWSTMGTYDDSIPEEDPNDQDGVFVVDSTNALDGDHMTKFELYGNMSSSAALDFVFYGEPTSTGTGYGPVIGQTVYHASDLNKVITVPYSGVYGASFTIQDTDPSSTGGSVYLHETWSTDTDVSSTGEIVWADPPWATSGGGTTVSTSTSVSGSTTNVYVNVQLPPPPDWQQVADTFVNTWLNSIPPIPDPPPPPAPQAQPVDPGMPQDVPNGLSDPPIDTPAPPPEQQGDTSDWTSGTSDAIPFDTTGDSSFSIGDPVGDLPHDPTGSMPIPGSTPNPGFTPNPQGAGSAPAPNQTPPQPPASVPIYQGSTNLIGSAPSPSYSGGSSSTVSPTFSGGSSTPTFDPSGNAGPTPSYSFPT